MSHTQTQEYLEKAAAIAGEVLEHFIIAGIPKLTPEQEREGALVAPVMKVDGHAGLLCIVADQTAVELHRIRLETDENSPSADDGNPSFN